MSVQGPLHYRGRYGKAIFAITLPRRASRQDAFRSAQVTVIANCCCVTMALLSGLDFADAMAYGYLQLRRVVMEGTRYDLPHKADGKSPPHSSSAQRLNIVPH